MSTATPSTIRDRSRVLLAAIDPVSLTGTRFRDSRNELAADFREWAEANPAAALRRFQIRNVGSDADPDVSNTDFDRRILTLEVVIAYPQTNRAGSDNAMDRDDLIDEDWDYINFNLGLYGRVNYSGTYDCTPLGHDDTKEIEHGEACDFLVVRFRYSYLRALAVGGLVQGVGG